MNRSTDFEKFSNKLNNMNLTKIGYGATVTVWTNKEKTKLYISDSKDLDIRCAIITKYLRQLMDDLLDGYELSLDAVNFFKEHTRPINWSGEERYLTENEFQQFVNILRKINFDQNNYAFSLDMFTNCITVVNKKKVSSSTLNIMNKFDLKCLCYELDGANIKRLDNGKSEYSKEYSNEVIKFINSLD